MRIVVTSEYHFVDGPDGVYTDAMYAYGFWSLLRDNFDDIVILARVGARPVDLRSHRLVEGPGVTVARLPDFVGARAGVRHLPTIAATALAVIRAADVALLRAPGVFATAAFAATRVFRRRYGIEVVGDPIDSLTNAGPGMSRFAAVTAGLLRRQIAGACASRYVTRHALQRRYPPPPGQLSVAVSDLELPDALFAEPAVAITDSTTLTLVWVGALSRPYKGVDVLLAALAKTKRPHRLRVVGDGMLRATLEAQVAQLELGHRVTFVGTVTSGAAVFDQLRLGDLFVLPSRTEGLPRAMLEAMAVGLPCVATPVGGVPELLPVAAHVPIGDPTALALTLDDVAADPSLRRAWSTANRDLAFGFRASERRRQLGQFYRGLRGELPHS
jgi:phosphatidyl-myo-inositol dimannoside synthase